MPEIADKILALPSKPPIELEDKLRELKKYDSLAAAPSDLLREIAEALPQDQLMAVWARKGYGFGRQVIYSIEDRAAGVATHDVHKQDYRVYNPALMNLYSPEEFSQFY